MPSTTQKNQSAENLERPPIVVVMGHVDHGKSTLLDYVRKTNVVAGEAGGITQHTSAYEVIHRNEGGIDKKITFLDTPGHAAFSLMRKRGAQIADIAVLVVAADDGVKAQTLEALQAIREKKTPYIVVINKIDKSNANIEKTKQELAGHEVYLEGRGGDIPVVEISAKTGEGVPELLGMILLVAELQELKGDTGVCGEGVVVESHRDSKRGNSATVVLTNGVLKKGTYGAAGDSTLSIKRIENFLGEPIDEATFSSPVELIGFSSIPGAGDKFVSFTDKKSLDEYAETVTHKEKHKKNYLTREQKIAESAEETTHLSLIVKADMLGTLEALVEEIEKIKVERITIEILHRGIGNISEFDVKRASGEKNAVVVGFHVGVEETARKLADQHGTPIKTFDIIYKISEWLMEECEKRKPRIKVEETTGKARIIRIFSTVKNKQVVGGKVLQGKLVEGRPIKIFRREHEIGKGRIVELQSQKVRTKEVSEGSEFGAMVEIKLEIAPNDTIEVFEVVEK